jgi:hypothetical protein
MLSIEHHRPPLKTWRQTKEVQELKSPRFGRTSTIPRQRHMHAHHFGAGLNSAIAPTGAI